ncbi:organic cation transporter protein [Folsomia candida]|uniref:organic cation transporter protein n=1 Tax=Folsomia candida TaxID=158441 RepID=UPI000B909B2C|nr:organic cation transporter protein [Folsomia candida]
MTKKLREAEHPTPFILTIPTHNHVDIVDIVRQSGGFGAYQFFILILLLVLEVPTAFVTFIPIFVGRVPQVWDCDNVTMSLSEVCSLCDTDAITPLDVLVEDSIVAQWGLICEKEWVFDFVTSIQMLGMFFGSVFGSQFADWYGRRYGFLAATLLLSLGSTMSALAGNPYIYALARFLCGAGVTSFMNVTLVGVVEVMPTKWRSLSNCIGPTGEGIMILSLLAYLIRPWRTLYWATVAPFVLIVVIYPFVPESPRWLLKQNRVHEAANILKSMARMNSKSHLTPTISPAMLHHIIQSEQRESPQDSNPSKRWTYLDFVKDPALRATSLYNMAIWFAWSLTYYGISFNIKNVSGNIYLNVFFMGAANAVGQRSALLLNNSIGRRKALFASMTFCAVFLVALAITLVFVEHSNIPNAAIVSLCLLGQFGMAAARSAARLISGESFPTAVRTMGMGIGGITANMAGILTPQLAYLGVRWPALPFFTFAAVSVGGSLIAFRMAETMGLPLDNQTPEVVEKDDNPFDKIFTNNNLHSEDKNTSQKDVNIFPLAKRDSNIKVNLKSEVSKNVVLISISRLVDEQEKQDNLQIHMNSGFVNDEDSKKLNTAENHSPGRNSRTF